MKIADIPENEDVRLDSLQALQILDTGAEAEFDALVHVASLVCGTPISLISLIDSERQWFKANIGLPGVSETPRDIAFCSHAILDDLLFEVTDTTLDTRFVDNPLVTDDPNIRFYAGAPITISDGSRVGTLCVIDREPKVLNDLQKEVLNSLAIAAAKALEGRQAIRKLHVESIARAEIENQFRALSESSPHGIFYADEQGACTYTNNQWLEIYDVTKAQSLGMAWTKTLHPEDKQKVLETWGKLIEAKKEFEMHFRIQIFDRRIKHLHVKASPIFAEKKVVIGFAGTVEDVTERILQKEALRKSEFFLDRTSKLAGIGGWEFDLMSKKIYWSDETCRIHGVPLGYQPNLEDAIRFYSPEARPIISNAVKESIETGKPWDLELPIINKSGEIIWTRSVGTAEFFNGFAVRLLGAFQNIDEQIKRRNTDKEAKDKA